MPLIKLSKLLTLHKIIKDDIMQPFKKGTFSDSKKWQGLLTSNEIITFSLAARGATGAKIRKMLGHQENPRIQDSQGILSLTNSWS